MISFRMRFMFLAGALVGYGVTQLGCEGCELVQVRESVQVQDWGVSLAQETDHIPNYELAAFDHIGAFGPPRAGAFRLVSGPPVFDKGCFCFVFTPPAPNCVPINEDGTYTISARAIWSLVGGTKRLPSDSTGVRELTIRLLRDGVWSTLAGDVVGSIPTEQVQQAVTTVDTLIAGDCVGMLAFFTSQQSELNFGVTSLLVSRDAG